MSQQRPVVVNPPTPSGGRRVYARGGEILGLARDLRDLAEFLRRAGLDLDPAEVAESDLIEWRGGGPHVWEAAADQ
ncbi:hypothetical protein [Streptomyces seoulensis]|uniref:hypothetical protein n=1 Tax=Streptomyces seoulensis TaxID=73044 RepID=UPI001FCAAB9B|nr:hypothetical protein [Streptomyces seoulensis]BDH04877.1 hypothetical protein HEK131_21040 [Streptomyces seoulensis]